MARPVIRVAEAYMVLRGSLESALYGLYVARKTSVGEVWLRRDEDDAAKKKVKQEFKVSNLFQVLESPASGSPPKAGKRTGRFT